MTKFLVSSNSRLTYVNQARTTRGFSLIELAVVLLIVSLLLGGLLVPLATQVQQRQVVETEKALEEVKEALIGFAASQTAARLPCPDTTGDGVEDACPSTASSSSGGNLPWVTLGVSQSDPWGQRLQYRVNGAFTAVGGFTLSTTGTSGGGNDGRLRVCKSSACATVTANNVPAVIYSSGKNGALQPPLSADELENVAVANTQFDRTFVSRTSTASNSGLGEFDDIVTWLSPNILFSRMIAAEKLPN